MALEFTLSSRYFFGQKDVQYSLPVPMVYEQVSAEPITWEYRVLTIDTREEPLPDDEQLNELGTKGWIGRGPIIVSGFREHRARDQHLYQFAGGRNKCRASNLRHHAPSPLPDC